MPKCDKLLERARKSPSDLRFTEICQLAECYGFVFDRQAGSHRIYKRRGWPQVINFQEWKGKAKPYQVRQLLKVIDLIQNEERTDA